MSIAEEHVGPGSSMIERVSAVLEALASSQRPLGLADLTRATGLPKTSTYRIAQDLVKAELLEREGSRYRLGLKLFELGSHVAARSLRNQLLPFLEELYTTTGGTVHFAVRQNDSVVYIEKIHGHDGVRRGSRIAGQLPMHATATGKAMLAFSPPEFIKSYLSRSLVPLTPRTIVVADVLTEELCKIKQRGWSHESEECVIGFSSVAAPILTVEDRAIGAISVTMPSRDLQVLKVATMVSRVTKALTV